LLLQLLSGTLGLSLVLVLLLVALLGVQLLLTTLLLLLLLLVWFCSKVVKALWKLAKAALDQAEEYHTW
jgi:multisubunit Na+/H+ antiporter MnhE subunit